MTPNFFSEEDNLIIVHIDKLCQVVYNKDMINYCVGKPKIYNEALFLKRVQEVLDSSWFTNGGKFVLELEKRLADLLGASHCIAVANATLGLELSLKALQTNKSQVITQSFTFPGTATAITNAGFTPIFCDIDNNYCITGVEEKVNDNTAAIMPVDLFGNLLPETPRVNGLPVVYDSAHAFTCDIAVSGDMMVYSFHSTKIMGACGEGGVIATDNEEYAKKLRELRNFGFNPLDPNTLGTISSIGTNAKMSELSAASILTQIECKQQILDHYLSNHYYYSRYLPKWVELRYPNHDNSNYSYIVCEVPENHRNSLIAYLHKNRIFAKKYFIPLHLEGPYKQNINLPNTEKIAKCILQLPTGLCVTREDIIHICDVISKYN